MTARETLERILAECPEDRLHEILDFARFLSWRDEHREWCQLGLAQFARAYGPDEPEYTPTDLKAEPRP